MRALGPRSSSIASTKPVRLVRLLYASLTPVTAAFGPVRLCGSAPCTPVCWICTDLAVLPDEAAEAEAAVGDETAGLRAPPFGS